MRRPFSIRTLLLLTVSGLTVLIALLVGNAVYQQWERLHKINALKTATLVSDPLFDVMERLSIERDTAYSLLFTGDSSLIKTLRPRLESSRKEADASVTETLQTLSQYDFPQLEEQIRICRMQFDKLQDMRRQVDAALALPLDKRDPALAQRWFDEVTETTRKTENVWLQFIKHFREVDPVVSLQMRFKYDLSAILENSGRERALIGKLIVQNADASPEEQAKLLRWQGAVDEAWGAADTLADQGKLYPAITPYFKEARSHYDNVYGMVKDIFYVPGARHGANYPFTADFWFELSEETTDSFYELKNASIKETHAYLDVLEATAQRVILWHMALLVFAVLLCFYSFHVITERVIHRINTMIKALVDTTEGKPVSFLPSAGRQDEVGKLAHVLDAFRENGERYRALVEASSQIIWTWRPDGTGKMEELFEWWAKITGLPASEMLPYGWVSVVHPADRELAQNIWTHAMTTGEDYTMEYRLLRREGGVCWVYVRGVGLKNADGSVRELVGALNDVTERKEAEAALLAYNRALERSNKELDDFAYIASHDLKEPLRGIHNHSRFLLEDNKDKLDPDSVSKLNRLTYLSQRMERLISDLLYFSRLGRQELAIQPTDMNSVIHDIESTLDVFLTERHAHIAIPKPLPTVTCDKVRITEAFRNLITNAVKYNDKPEKRVEIGFLEMHPLPNGVAVKDVFYVKDEGKGIAPEFHHEVFRIFKRLQGGKGTEEEGTGVGLTFVKKIIDRHGGMIWLESRPGQGSTFYFTLKEQAHDTAAVA